ncbi:molecular chaperone [Erythrobacter sp. SCSIO 43205]|uniref:molecular chaperone n=1 Tax=Erythrobacter sp. SCSIO 43205 TaxID=2779361 RepID=UPI001CA85868|nr:molecular chaperone [Erythrobacter sp. SCSIO 43205]UAB78480.1 molecular chaperone [Erythrobacter sp. SCSIO 43205]
MFLKSLRNFTTIAASFAAFAALSITVPAQAQGDLLVAPTRVILDGSRGTEVILSNIGAQEATYRIGLDLRRMTEDGRLEPVEKVDANETEEAALGMIRYAPRRISLPPGQPQAVRLSARPGADLPDGEYRVHMSFKAIPRPTEVTQEETQSEGVTLRLIPIYGITIPIIVRHGKVEAQVALTQPSIVQGDKGPELAMTIERTGESSTYGVLSIVKPGLPDPIVLAGGIAVYPEVGSRKVRINLTEEQAAALRGPARIEYRELEEKGGALIAAVDGVIG